MMTVIEPPSVLSSPQRRSQVLLMFYLPGQSVTPEWLGSLTQVDEDTARQDIAETGREIQRYHPLNPDFTSGRQLSDGRRRASINACACCTLCAAGCACARILSATILPGVKNAA